MAAPRKESRSNQRNAVGVKRTKIILAFLVFALALLIYRANDGYLISYDSAPNSLFLFNTIEHRTLAFDDFRGGHFYDVGAGYIFSEAPNGHLEPIFPIGPAIISAPLYAAQYLIALIYGPFPDITAAAFEPTRLRDEKWAANAIGALAAALFVLCALRLSTPYAALIATIAFAFGSEMWTIGGQALWQHGSVALATLAMVLALLQGGERPISPWRLAVAGFFGGLLTTIRPTAIFYSLAGLAFALDRTGVRCWSFMLGAAVGAAPGIAWNLLVFGSLAGGYSEVLGVYCFCATQIETGLAGLLVSPSRGLLLYMPWVIVTVPGAIRAFRVGMPDARLLRYLTIASALTFVNYVLVRNWNGGSTFGPRYLTDLIPTAGLLLAYALPALIKGNRRAGLALAMTLPLIGFGVLVQMAGANGDPKSNWSAVPFDISDRPERIWQVTDSQIVRDALTTYHLWRPNPTWNQAFADGFSGQIENVRCNDRPLEWGGHLAVRRLERLTCYAAVRNTGTSQWLGYDTGFYYGQTRVRLRLIDRLGAVRWERNLFVKGAPPGGSEAQAEGVLDALPAIGLYTAAFDIDVFQDPRIGSRHVGLRSLRLLVTP